PTNTNHPPGLYTATLEVNHTHVTSTRTSPIAAANRAPTGTIPSPSNGASFNAGDSISFAATGSDPEDGALGPASFSWTIVLHHDTHTHPYLGPIGGVTAGSFTATDKGETSPNIWYEISLTVTDSGAPLGASGALSTESSVSIYPNLSTMTFATAPRTDLSLTLDGTPFAAPKSVVGVVGTQRVIEAITPQFPGDGHTYVFS